MFNSHSNDKLPNLVDLSDTPIYISLALSILAAILYFIFFIYPTMTVYATNKAQIVSVSILEQQLKQIKTLYHESRTQLGELKTDTLLTSLQNVTDAPYNLIDLHRLAHEHQLTIIAMDSSNDIVASPQFTNYFATTHYSWNLRGYFFNYLAFKNALWEQHPLIYIEREHLSISQDQKLDIVVDIHVYQPKDTAL